MRLIPFIIPVPLWICSCTPGPADKLPDAKTPAIWQNSGGFPTATPHRDIARWWKHFNDPTLTRLIGDGLTNSPDIATAAAKVREARARRDESSASLFPNITGAVSTNHNRTRTDGAGTYSTELYSAKLNASWEADLFGKNKSKVQAANARLNAENENSGAIRAALAAEIATAYTKLRAYETGLDIVERIVVTREETSRLATWRNQAGAADSLESSQATSSLEQARAAIPSLKQSIAQTRNQLSLLCGRSPGSLDRMLSTGRGVIPTPAGRMAVGIPADTIRQRPDVRNAGWQVIAAQADTRAAKAEKYPALNLSGTVGVESLKAGKIFDPQTASAGLIAGLTGSIFDAGRIRSNIEAQGAVTGQALQAYRSAILTALSEVEDALIACKRSGERLGTLEKATIAARDAARIAEQRYQAGIIDLLTVLDSQRTLLGLEDNLLTARGDHTNAHIQLYKALGGGWS